MVVIADQFCQGIEKRTVDDEIKFDAVLYRLALSVRR